MQDTIQEFLNDIDSLSEFMSRLKMLVDDIKQEINDAKALKGTKNDPARKAKCESRRTCLQWLEDDVSSALRELDEADRRVHLSPSDGARDGLYNLSDTLLRCFVRGTPPDYEEMLEGAEYALASVQERIQALEDRIPLCVFASLKIF